VLPTAAAQWPAHSQRLGMWKDSTCAQLRAFMVYVCPRNQKC